MEKVSRDLPYDFANEEETDWIPASDNGPSNGIWVKLKREPPLEYAQDDAQHGRRIQNSSERDSDTFETDDVSGETEGEEVSIDICSMVKTHSYTKRVSSAENGYLPKNFDFDEESDSVLPSSKNDVQGKKSVHARKRKRYRNTRDCEDVAYVNNLNFLPISATNDESSGEENPATEGTLSCRRPSHKQKAKTSNKLALKDILPKDLSSLATKEADALPKCFACDLVTEGGHEIPVEKSRHTCMKPYVCNICNAAFILKYHLQSHEKSHASGRPYKCDYCEATFVQGTYLARHMRSHTGEKPFKCDICSAAFADSGPLKRHRRTHTGEKPFKCKLCVAAFTDSGNLTKHLRTHTGEKPYKCEVCHAAFSQDVHRREHLRTHTGERPYTCEVCQGTFIRSSQLKCHMKTHVTQKSHVCVICADRFCSSRDLNKHVRTHTGGKPFTCDLCLAAFATSSQRDRHLRIHTGEKPYKCKICNATFSASGNMKRHTRTHTGERPYKCDGCELTFAQVSNLKRHIRNHSCGKVVVKKT